jgi:20S proteasome subunit alpha 3
MQAIDNAGAAVGILAKDGVVIGAEKKQTSKLLAKPKVSEKLYMVDDHVAVAVAGLTADANVLIDYLRRTAANHKLSFQEPQPIEQLVRQICDAKQVYTQRGGMRPFGVSFLFAGFDRHLGFQLYRSDPSGNYGAYRASAIGANNKAATSLLVSEFNPDLSAEATLELAVKVLIKTMDTTKPTADKMEFIFIKKRESVLTHQVVRESEVQAILDKLTAQAAPEADV